MQIQMHRWARWCSKRVIASIVVVIAGFGAASGAHAEPALKTLYTFCRLPMCADGYSPEANVILDNRGNLYGTTAGYDLAHGYGNVYELSPPSPGKANWTEISLHNFTYLNPNDGADPVAGVIFDSSGNLYGTTETLGYIEIHGKQYSGGGTVFELSPPADGKEAWTETILHAFPCACYLNRDGSAPQAGVVFLNDSLYGTTIEGGVTSGAQNGTVFQVTPPARRGETNWTEKVVYVFKGDKDGSIPIGGVIPDKLGNLYGTTTYDGSTYPVDSAGEVFKLTPPVAGEKVWKKITLYNFTGSQDGAEPTSDLVADDLGNLYGTTIGGGIFCDPAFPAVGCGVVFELSPPTKGRTKWTETVLYSFRGGNADGIYPSPRSRLVRDSAGNLYGETLSGGNPACPSSGLFGGCGVVFELSPPAKGTTIWTETILHFFSGKGDGAAPDGGVTLDDKGNVYGTTAAVPGTVFMISGVR